MPLVSLHSHTSESSQDATNTDAEMAQFYRERGIVSAVTDHDVFTESDRLVGIERTIEKGRKLHVVEFPEHGFSFLPHPRRPFPTNTKQRATAYIEAHGLDAVEKFSQGKQQYEGHIDGVIELANDDAHNHWQIGLSYMSVDARADDPGSILAAIRRGQHRLHNEFDPGRYAMGKTAQGVSMVAERFL